jgi:hypothetical protein
MSNVILHYRLHFLGDLVWEQAKSIERSAGQTTDLSRTLKGISGQLHEAAPKLPTEHALEHGQTT